MRVLLSFLLWLCSIHTSVESIPEFLLDAQKQWADMFSRMVADWIFAYYLSKRRNDAMVETLNTLRLAR